VLFFISHARSCIAAISLTHLYRYSHLYLLPMRTLSFLLPALKPAKVVPATELAYIFRILFMARLELMFCGDIVFWDAIIELGLDRVALETSISMAFTLPIAVVPV
jgi:hypothetical protein